MNCLALEQDDGILIVDCGTSFPHDDLGVDVIRPDFSWLEEHADRVNGLFLTHGHEDHIGAVSFLLECVDVPIWGPPHALALVRRRLADRGFPVAKARLTEVDAGQTVPVGPFEVEPIRVTHSITQATALAIRTGAGLVVHSGDFNLDADPPDGEPTDEARLKQLGDEGVALLLSDSTNSDVEQRLGSEREVGDALERSVAAASGRVFIALFSSNVQRLRCLGQIAEATGRKLCLLGRSLGTQVEAARRVGKLHWPSNLVVSPEQAAKLQDSELMLLVGGSQAEPQSALRRLSLGEHHQFQLVESDTVILSSRIIPGNERTVNVMLCDLLRRGVRLETRLSNPAIHTSGHAGRSEQRRFIELLRPRAFLPVHGTLHHMLRHAQLARDAGVADTIVTENGAAVAFAPERGLYHDGSVPHGKVSVAPGGEPLSTDVLRRRGELGRSGSAWVSVVLSESGVLVGEPTVTTRGIPGADGDDAALRRVARAVKDALSTSRRVMPVEELVKRAARRVFVAQSGLRPVIEVHVLRVG